MKRGFSHGLQACLLAGLVCLSSTTALAQRGDFSFGVIAHVTRLDDVLLREAITETDADNLAFVVVNGFKLPAESCSDELYLQRRSLLDSAKNGVFVSLAASDWLSCGGQQDHSASIGRLNHVRELFFANALSLGASKLPLIRQSGTAKFRNYAENARWEFGDIMFATVNLPGENNHFLREAGRNSEFEDRQIATAEWLQRIFIYAARKKMAGIVLFSDGDPMTVTTVRSLFNSGAKRDGFREVRKQLMTLAGNYRGKVLLVTGEMRKPPTSLPAILWQKNLGTLAAQSGQGAWVKLRIRPDSASLFEVVNAAVPENDRARGK